MTIPHRLLAAWVTSAASLFAQSVLEGPEPNDDAANATPLPCWSHGYGHLRVAGGDVDFWSFTIGGVSDVDAYVTSRGARDTFNSGTSVDDVILTLFGTDGVTVLAINDDYVDRPFDRSGYFPKIHIAALPAGTYYLKVVGWTLTRWGDYAIELACSPPVPSPFCGLFTAGATETEPNGLPADTGVLQAPCCETHGGTIASANDLDLWRVVLATDTRVVLSATGDVANPLPLLDPEIWVFQADGVTLIDFDDDSGPNRDPRLQLDLAAGTYLAMVRGFGTATGSYVLTTDCAPRSALPSVADFVADSDSSMCPGSSGVSLTIVPRFNEYPRLGTEFAIDIHGSAAPVLLLGFARFEPAIDLGIIGAPGCLLSIDPAFAALATTPTVAAEAEFRVALSTDPVLDGSAVFLQAAALDSAANGLGITTSDRVALTIGADG